MLTELVLSPLLLALQPLGRLQLLGQPGTLLLLLVLLLLPWSVELSVHWGWPVNGKAGQA